MTGLEKITAGIIDDAKAYAEKVIANAEAECRAIDESYSKRAAELREAMLAEAEAELSSAVSKVKSTAAIDRRNVMLAAKSKLVDEAFEMAEKDVRSMPADKYLRFLTDLLTNVMVGQIRAEENELRDYGDGELEAIESYEILLNKDDRDAYGQELVKNVKAALAGKNAKAAADKIRLSDKTADIGGGAVLRYGDVEINCSLEMIFGRLKSSLETEVFHILFRE